MYSFLFIIAAIVCPVLTAPANGNAPSCTDANNYGSQCTFSCLAGFDLVGQSVLTCGGDGTSTAGSYDFAAPTCAGESSIFHFICWNSIDVVEIANVDYIMKRLNVP